MLRRFKPYLRYLKSNRGTLAAAIFYGLIFGLTSGLGFPVLVKYAFPPIFNQSGAPLPYQTILLIVGCVPLIFLLRAVSGYLSGDPPQIHFGLPQNAVVQRLEIRWPDGKVSNIANPAAQTLIRVTR